MLRLLRIENLVLAREVALEFAPGLNLITGETGAGKSLIGGAIGLALAGRAEASLVRQGEERALVEALFDITHRPELASRLLRAGFDSSDGELLIRRELAADGRSKAFLNGQTVTVGLLRELTAGLLEAHGQGEPMSLLSPETHRQLLDRFGGHDDLLHELRRHHGALREVATRLAELTERATQRQQRIELVRFRLAEVEALRPEPGEEQRLRAERDRLRHRETLVETLQAALDALYEGEGAAVERIHAAARRLKAQGAHDPTLIETADRLGEVRTTLQDLCAELRDQLESLAGDPGRLEQIEERLIALDRLRRRFDGAALEAIVADVDALQRELNEFEQHDSVERELSAERTRVLALYAAAAERLSAARTATARRFAAEIGALLDQLAMKPARLEVAIEPAPARDVAELPGGADGVDSVEFQLAANPGEPARPLRRVASGGELSRVMLALDIALEGGLARRTLLFDEVDQGLGGDAADRLGEFLVRVARHHQVICITHLPQVAARAQNHISVSKKLKAGRTFAVVKALEDEDDRIEEVARMLGGTYVTETARRHAEAMVRGAGAR